MLEQDFNENLKERIELQLRWRTFENTAPSYDKTSEKIFLSVSWDEREFLTLLQ